MTLEIPGGHREAGEDICVTARRELWEETGARQFELQKVCAYSVTNNGETSFGMLYFANITVLGKLPESEIEEVVLFDPPNIPKSWTYPEIQPLLFEKIKEKIWT